MAGPGAVCPRLQAAGSAAASRSRSATARRGTRPTRGITRRAG
ncbi:MAG: hypothetical protein ACK55Z_19980 [bacterium]